MLVPKPTVLSLLSVPGVLHGSVRIPGAKELSKCHAFPCCKFFFWLALPGRYWTSDRLQRHNMQNQGSCALCNQETEIIQHLTLTCVYAQEVWFHLLRRVGLHGLTPSREPTIVDWWLPSRKRVPKAQRKGFSTLVLLTCWKLWKERNNRVFNTTTTMASHLARDTVDEGLLWIAAGHHQIVVFSSVVHRLVAVRFRFSADRPDLAVALCVRWLFSFVSADPPWIIVHICFSS